MKGDFMSNVEYRKEPNEEKNTHSVSEDDETLNLEMIRKWEINHPEAKGQPVGTVVRISTPG